MNTTPCFVLGSLVATPAALNLLATTGLSPAELLHRHQRGDWGDICAEDEAANNDALKCGERLLSVYRVGDGKVWVITEADRSVTTLLLPEDY